MNNERAAGDDRPPSDFAALKARITASSERMPKRLLQCARFVLDNPDQTALGTTGEIALAAEVQPSTLVRFAQSLGFSGFSEMQALLKDNLLGRGQSYEGRLRRMRAAHLDAPDAILAGLAASAHAALDRSLAEIDGAALGRAVDVLARAKVVHLLGLRRSFPVASYLYYTFGKMGRRCVLLDNLGGVLSDCVTRIDPGDALLVASFHPYAQEAVDFARAAQQVGCAVISITDTTLSPLSALSSEVLHVQDAEIGAFRSLAATMCLSTALAVAIGQKLAKT